MKKLFKIQFLDSKKEILTIHASKINTSSLLGLLEVEDIVFVNSSEILLTPADDKVRIEFKDVERTFLPVSSIIRVDEITMEKETPVIRLYKGGADADT